MKKSLKEKFFSFYSSNGPYALHEFEDAWEETEIKLEECLIAEGEVLNFAFMCLGGKP